MVWKRFTDCHIGIIAIWVNFEGFLQMFQCLVEIILMAIDFTDYQIGVLSLWVDLEGFLQMFHCFVEIAFLVIGGTNLQKSGIEFIINFKNWTGPRVIFIIISSGEVVDTFSEFIRGWRNQSFKPKNIPILKRATWSNEFIIIFDI